MIATVTNSFPTALPLPLIDVSGASKNSTISSPIESAVILRRQRFTRNSLLLGVNWMFTLTELKAFRAWYVDDLGNGVSLFSIDLRLSKKTILTAWVCRFLGGFDQQETDGLWSVQAQLELVRPVEMDDFVLNEILANLEETATAAEVIEAVVSYAAAVAEAASANDTTDAGMLHEVAVNEASIWATDTQDGDNAASAPTDYVAWYDASQMADADYTLVDVWPDLTGNGNHFNRTQGTFRVRTNIQNGLRGLQAEGGSGPGMRAVGPTLTAGTDWTVVGIVKWDNAANVDRALNMYGSNTGLISGDSSTTRLRDVWVNGTTVIMPQTVGESKATRVHAHINRGSVGKAVWKLQGGGAITTTGNVAGGVLAIGYGGSIGVGFSGYWFELRVWNRALSNVEVDLVMAELTTKWAPTDFLIPTSASPDTVANLEVWSKADGLAGADGSTVSAWADLSGNGRDFGTVVGTPLLRYNSQNGLKGVEFGTGAGLAGAYSQTTGDMTIVLVAKSNNSTNTGRRAIQGSNNWLIGPYSNQWRVYADGFYAVPGFLDDECQVLIFRKASNVGSLRINNSLVAETATTAMPGYVNMGIVGPATTEPFLGLIYEVAVWSRALTAQEMTDVHAYMKAKWGTY